MLVSDFSVSCSLSYLHLASYIAAGGKPGSVGESKPADDEARTAFNRVLSAIITKYPDLESASLSVVSYASQVRQNLAWLVPECEQVIMKCVL